MRGLLLLLVATGCWHGSKEPAAASNPNPPDAAVPEEQIAMVTSFVMVEACPEAKHLDTKAATREIDELVGPCKKVPTGAAHFSATLLPGGRVELASPSGDPAAGVVPTCLLQNASQLKHKLRLKQACKFDVKLEQRGD